MVNAQGMHNNYFCGKHRIIILTQILEILRQYRAWLKVKQVNFLNDIDLSCLCQLYVYPVYEEHLIFLNQLFFI